VNGLRKVRRVFNIIANAPAVWAGAGAILAHCKNFWQAETVLQPDWGVIVEETLRMVRDAWRYDL